MPRDSFGRVYWERLADELHTAFVSSSEGRKAWDRVRRAEIPAHGLAIPQWTAFVLGKLGDKREVVRALMEADREDLAIEIGVKALWDALR